jgi:hypothetical protein
MTKDKAPANNAKQPEPLQLDEPIKRGESEIKEVSLRRPDAGSLRGLKMIDVLQMDVSALQTLIPRISQPTLTAADVAAMCPADLLQFGTEVASFFMTRAELAAAGLSQPA